MSKGITISQKHGVNPAIPTCFWCGESKNEIVLFGRLPGDREAPRNVIVDYDPCDKCKDAMAQGIMLAEASQQPVNGDFPPIVKKPESLWPTGRWLMVTPDFVLRNFKKDDDPTFAEDIIKNGKCLIDPAVFSMIIAELKEAGLLTEE